MKISNLIGFPKETDDFVMVEIPEIKIKFFWTPEGGGRLCEVRTGSCVFKGTLSRCRAGLKKILKENGIEEFTKRVDAYPSVEEFEEARRKLLKLHRRYRIQTGTKLQKQLNKNSIAGDLYIPVFPDTENESVKNIFWRIQKIQERKLKNDKEE